MDFFHDIIVIGAGGAGLNAALEIKKQEKIDVAVISKVYPVRSHTGSAQGGINAALSNNISKGKDSIESHILDTIKGGDYLSDQDAVKLMCNNAPKAIIELEHLGCVFSRDENGNIAQRPFGGAGFPRTCFLADITGHAILQCLYEQTLKNNIKIYDEFYSLELIIEEGVCKGIIALELKTGEIHQIKAKAVILATGGAGRVYENSTNGHISTGDGLRMAYQAGVALKDMEFVQFHPTTLPNSGILITEAARGEGGYLKNKNGERFMKKYAPAQMELASRDVISKAMQTEINEERDINGNLLLDLTHLGEKKILTKLPQIRELCLDFAGIDCVKNPIPIKPGAHYMMGGIDVNINTETSIKGLFAVGECAALSVHGANRLGGNSLLEIIVFGAISGKNATNYVKNITELEIKHDYLKRIKEKIINLKHKETGEKVAEIRDELQKTMSQYLGIFRDEEGMQKAKQKIEELKNRFKRVKVYDQGTVFNYNLTAAFELEGLIDIASAITHSALNRKESRGAHARTDFKDKSNKIQHSLCYYKAEGEPRIEWKDVVVTRY